MLEEEYYETAIYISSKFFERTPQCYLIKEGLDPNTLWKTSIRLMWSNVWLCRQQMPKICNNLEKSMSQFWQIQRSLWTQLRFNKAKNKESKAAASASFVSKYGNTAPRQNTEIQKHTSKYGIISRNIPRL